MARYRVALAHDYLTQRGGAERVALIMSQAFPESPLHTTLYEPAATYPEFADVDVRTSVLNTVPMLRRRHRLALPVLAPAVSRMRVDADVALLSSSGWAHGMAVTGKKVVYCHAPARWLYQSDRYLSGHAESGKGRSGWARPAEIALRALQRRLRAWDAAAARTADVYLANSTVTRDAIRQVYGIDAEIVHPPPALPAQGAAHPVAGLDPGFLLCVSRLLPYKNVDLIVEAVTASPDRRLVVVGQGPDRSRLERASIAAGGRVVFHGSATDAELRWLYANCSALVSASFEDFGLSPLEAATFGRPAVVLAAGGFLDTVRHGETGVFFPTPDAAAVVTALAELDQRDWSAEVIRAHAETFGVSRFKQRLSEIVDEAAG